MDSIEKVNRHLQGFLFLVLLTWLFFFSEQNQTLWNDVIHPSISEQSSSSSPSYDTVHTYRFYFGGGELQRTNTLSIDPAVIISPVFVKAAERKQAAVKKPARQREGRGRWGGGEGLGGGGGRYVVISNERLSKAMGTRCISCSSCENSWEVKSKFCFECRCLVKTDWGLLHFLRRRRLLSLGRLGRDAV